MLISFLGLNLLLYLLLHKNIIKSISFAILFSSIMISSEILSTFTITSFSIWSNALINLKPSIDLSNEMIMLGQCLFITYFCSTSLVWFLLTNSIKIINKIKILLIIFAVAVFQISFFLNIYFYNSTITSDNMVETCLLYCILSVVIYITCVFDINSSFFEKQRELENLFLHQKQEHIFTYYQLARLNQEKIYKIQHDLSNQILCLRNLMETDVDKAKEFITGIGAIVNERNSYFDTGNIIVDTVLTIKENQAKNDGILIDIEIGVLDEKINNIQDIDLCNILTNILDNAIYSTKENNMKEIHFKISQKDKYLVIHSNNTYEGDFVTKNGKVLSSKRDNLKEGYGLKILHDIAKKYDGIVDYYIEKDLYYINLLINNS